MFKRNIPVQVASCCLLLCVFCSCSIKKRVYLRGFYVSVSNTQWHSQNQLKSQKNKTLTDISVASEIANQESVQRITGARFEETGNDKITPPASEKIRVRTNFNCDTLILITGKKVACRITEISPLAVKVRNCTGTGATVSEFSKFNLKEIVYANGSSEKIDREELKASERTEKLNAATAKTKEKSGGARSIAAIALTLAVLFYPCYILVLFTWSILFAFLGLASFLLSAVLIGVSASRYSRQESVAGQWMLYVAGALLLLPLAIPLLLTLFL